MPRNLDWRVELLVPVESEKAKEKLKSILKSVWQDNEKARKLQRDVYIRRKPKKNEKKWNVQEKLLNEKG